MGGIKMMRLIYGAALVSSLVGAAHAQSSQPAPTSKPGAVNVDGTKSPSISGPAAADSPKCPEACVRANNEKASAICARKIEAQAPGDFEWISRPFSGIFQQADPSKPDNAIVNYRGDSIRFLSPQKEWVRVSYECAFDAERGTVVGVRVRPGRLDQPMALQAPPGSNGQPQQTGPVKAGPLAEAILKAAKQRGAQPQKPPPPKVSEPSPIDFTQIDSRRGSW